LVVSGTLSGAIWPDNPQVGSYLSVSRHPTPFLALRHFHIMKIIRISAIGVALALSMAAGSASAAGCLKGAVVGGVAGHYAHHHAVVGAVGGCIVGRHMAKEHAQEVAAAKAHQGGPAVQ
jgi:hypothetical protein